MKGKLKSFLLDDGVFYSMLVLLVGIIAFGLGRQSIPELAQTPGAGVQYVAAVTESVPTTSAEPDSVAVAVVVSRSGTKYHLPTCPGAKQIKESNLISFPSVAAAQAAGYTAAANCEGL